MCDLKTGSPSVAIGWAGDGWHYQVISHANSQKRACWEKGKEQKRGWSGGDLLIPVSPPPQQ